MVKDYSNQIYNDYEKALVKLDKIMDKLSNIEKEHKKEIKDLKDNFKVKTVSLYNKIDSLTIDLKETNKLNEKYLNKINELTLEIERLKNNNNKNSSNSSKPSSTNGYKKVIINNREKSNSKQGGQKGHKGSTLTQSDVDKMIDDGLIDEVIEIEENKNNNTKNNKPIITYEYDIKIKRIVTKHIYYPETNKEVRKPVIYGNNIKILSNMLNMRYMSLDGIKSFFNEITNGTVNPSKGTLFNWNKEISNCLNMEKYENIKEELMNSLVINVDESPIKINGKQYYLHNISNGYYTLQYVSKYRGKKAINEFDFLNKYQGIIIHDHYSMYYKYGTGHGECNVHVLRYLNAVIEFTKHKWAKNLKALLKELNNHKKELMNNNIYEISDNDYNKFKERYLEILNKGKTEYNDSLKSNAYKEEERGLLNRLIKYVDNHLLFLKKFYVEFSNNQAETDLRPAKIKQKIGKFRSIEGAEIYAITRSCYSTYKKNKENIYNSLNELLLKTKAI